MNETTLQDFRLPTYRELPNIGLYLEQTVQYINGFMAPLGLPELTPSMVSNYVKKGLITPPVKKQYNAEQLAQLFFISAAKSVLSMDDIGRMLTMQKATYPDDIAYDYFCKELRDMVLFVFGLKDAVDTPTMRHPEEKGMLRSMTIAVSHMVYLHSRLKAYYETKE